MIEDVKNSMIGDVKDSIKVEAVTRRTILTRDLKALCAMAAVPTIAQMISPRAAFAHRSEQEGDWWWGRDRDYGDGGRHHDHDGGGDYDHDGGRHHDHDGGHGSCFLRGTKIATVTGESAVEDLAVGDLLPTAFGGARPIQWIGRFKRTKSDLTKPWAKHARPVRIARSALAPNVPHADLYVTRGHALFVDDLLVPAGSLVNDTTISLYAAEAYAELEFFHIKLETHDVIFAEGAPCETLLQVNKTMNNVGGCVLAHGTTEASEVHCAPIICNGPRSELKTRVRSLMSPWLGPQKFDDIRARLEERAMALV